jgi:hypothetical protein
VASTRPWPKPATPGRPGRQAGPRQNPPPRATAEAEIAAICKPRWVAEVITATLTGQRPAGFRLAFTVDAAARKALETRLFGKRILLTNRDSWPVAEVVAAYRSQSGVEFGFGQLKDPHMASFSPTRHWTDQKIRVHVLCAVLALTIAHLMRRAAEHAGLRPPSANSSADCPASARPSCSAARAAKAGPAPNACSPT